MGIINRDGALWMATGVDNSGLYSGFNQAENRVDQFEAHIKKVGDNITKLTGVGLGVAGLKAFGSEIVNVRGEMQMLESSFEVLLGGKGVSGFMAEMKQFAVDSPLSMNGVANAAQTLLGFGITAEKIMPTIKQIGDISMGNEERFKSLSLAFAQMSATGKLMGQDLLQMINAGFNPLQTISEKTGKSIGDLKKEMESGSISSQMVADAFASATAEGGKFYGMTQKQAEGIRGLQAQLEGGLQDAFNEIGKSQDGLIAGGYKAATVLVENYDKVGKAIIGLIISYGAYKAALVLAMQAEAGWSVAQLATYNRLLLVEKAQKLVNATMLSNPYVLATVVTLGLVAAVWNLYDATTIQERAQRKLNDITEEATKRKEELENATSRLIGVINSETKTYQDRITAFRELQGIYPDLLKNMDMQVFKAMSVTDQQKLLNKALNDSDFNDINEKIKVYEGTLTGIEEHYQKASVASNEFMIEARKLAGLDSFWSKSFSNKEDIKAGLNLVLDGLRQQLSEQKEIREEAEFMSLPEADRTAKLKGQLEELNKQKYSIESQMALIKRVNSTWAELDPTFIGLNKQLGGILSKIQEITGKLDSNKGETKNKSFWETQKKNAEAALEAMDKSQKGDTKWKAQLKLLNEANSNLKTWDFSGKSDKATESAADKAREASLKLLNLQAELDNESVNRQLEYEQKLLDIEQDSFDKRYRQNQLNLLKEFQSVEEYRQKIAKSQQDAAKDIYVKKNGSDKGFDFASFDTSLLPEGLKPSDIEAQVKSLTDAALAAFKKGNADISKELQLFADEENLTFASQLDQQIYSIRKHYAERRLLAQENANLTKQINENENREVIAARLQSHQRQLEADADYNQKYQQLVEDRYVFELDKQKASLEQQIKDQQALFNNLEKQVLNDPSNDELANQLKAAYIQLKLLNKELEKTKGQKLSEIADFAGSIFSSLGSMTGVDFSPLSGMLSSLASFSTGDTVGGISAGLGVVSGIVSSIISKKEQEAAIQRELNNLQQQYNIDLRQQNLDLISSVDYARAFGDSLEALNWLVQKGFISDKNYSAWDALYDQWKVAKDNASQAEKEYDNVYAKAVSKLNGLWDNREGLKKANKQAVGVLQEWKNGSLTVEQALEKLQATGLKGNEDLLTSLQKLKDESVSLADTIVELKNQMDEFATGTSFDSFLSDASNAIKDLRGDITGLGEFTEDTLTNAILSSFKYQILSAALKPMYDELADMFLSGDYDASAANDWKQRLTDILSTNSQELDKIFEAFGIDPSDTVDATSKGIASISQDSANELNGNFFALLQKTGDIRNIAEASRLLLSGINNGVIDIQSIMKENGKVFADSLGALIKIEKNTARAADILDKLNTIGITIRN